MGACCELDPKNVIVVNIEELSEEDQRKYAQEYIKKRFLSGVKKDHSGKVKIAQHLRIVGYQTEQRNNR
jgi:hypothetical protein